MESFYRALGSANSGDRTRTPLSSASLSTSDEEDRRPRHRRRSGHRMRGTYRGGDYPPSIPSTAPSRPSHRHRESHHRSMAEEEEEEQTYPVYFSSSSSSSPVGVGGGGGGGAAHLFNAESGTREYVAEAEWGISGDARDDEAVLMEDFPVPAWSQGSRLIERRILQAVDARTEELSGAALQQEDGSGHSGASAAAPVPFRRFSIAGRAPPLAPSPPTDTSPLLLLRPRMQEADAPADPRNRLLDLVITNATASITLAEMEQAMAWDAQYAGMYGPLQEYLQSYQSIFVVSPVDDRVRLRRLFSVRTNALTREGRRSSASRQRYGRRTAQEGSQRSHSAADRRSGKPSLPSAEALAAHIGSVSYSCVAEHLDLEALETVYHRRGYKTEVVHAVLHVSSENSFDLFIFAGGAVVWWGMNRTDHWMVDDDFLSSTNYLVDGVVHRYAQADIDALYPIWCSYELDELCEVVVESASPLGFQSVEVELALDRLAKVLCFDHYLVPASEPARSLVMLTFSHSLGRSARVDYFEYVTKWSHRHILSIPAEFSGLLDYFSTKRRIAKLEGEIAVAQLAIQSIHDAPEVLWEVPWLQGYFDMAEQQNTAESRLSWFTSRSDTLLEQLSHIKGRRYRLFMLGSDVFLIVILILDVMFMTSRLVAKMYFKVDEDD
ncbi:putative ACR, YagE family [Novymonas esmeraldas]|uniref:ACR, YagE family n=1 Tax=Novymonas esmeraldas TaxID=1808958 RepID=A0AAW0F7B2_9TRYP